MKSDDIEVKHKVRNGFMGSKVHHAEIRFKVPGAHVLIKIDPGGIYWSQNGVAMFKTIHEFDTVLATLKQVKVEVLNRNNML